MSFNKVLVTCFTWLVVSSFLTNDLIARKQSFCNHLNQHHSIHSNTCILLSKSSTTNTIDDSSITTITSDSPPSQLHVNTALITGSQLSTWLNELKYTSNNPKQEKAKLLFISNNLKNYSTTQCTPIVMTTYEIGKSFLGLQNIALESTNNEAKIIIKTLIKIIQYKSNILDIRTIANIIFSMKSSTGQSVEIRKIIQIICEYIEHNKSTFTTQLSPKYYSMIMRGFRLMNNKDNIHLSRLLYLLSTCLETKLTDLNIPNQTINRYSSQNEPFQFTNGEELSSTFSGFAKFDWTDPVVLSLLNSTLCMIPFVPAPLPTLASPIKQSFIESVNERHIAMIVYSLQNLVYKSPLTTDFLTTTTTSTTSSNTYNSSYRDRSSNNNVNTCTDGSLSNQCNAIYEMLFDKVSSLVSSYTGILGPASLANMLYGMCAIYAYIYVVYSMPIYCLCT